MDEGFGSIKLVVIVLVVLAQGVSSFTKWLKKKREAARQKEVALGLPGNREEEPVAAEAGAIDWDTWGQEEEAPAPPQPTQPQPQAQRQESVIREEARTSTTAVAATPVPSLSDPAPSASMHRVIAAHAARPGAGRSSAMGSRPSLRSMLLGKIVLDPPVSARHGSARSPRG